MDVPSQGTVAVGDKITASLWNDDVRDAVNFLTDPPRCKLRKSVTQVIPTATNTAITWDTEVYDTDTMHDNATNNTRITFTTAGTYLITLNAMWGASATGTRRIVIEKNGTTYGTGTAVITPFATPGVNFAYNGATVSVEAQFSAGEYILVWGYQDSTANLNFAGTAEGYSNISARWVAT